MSIKVYEYIYLIAAYDFCDALIIHIRYIPPFGIVNSFV